MEGRKRPGRSPRRLKRPRNNGRKVSRLIGDTAQAKRRPRSTLNATTDPTVTSPFEEAIVISPPPASTTRTACEGQKRRLKTPQLKAEEEGATVGKGHQSPINFATSRKACEKSPLKDFFDSSVFAETSAQDESVNVPFSAALTARGHLAIA